MVDLKFEVYTSHQTGLHDVVYFFYFFKNFPVYVFKTQCELGARILL